MIFRNKEKNKKSHSLKSLIPQLINKVKEETRMTLTVGAMLIGTLTAGIITTTPNPVYGINLFGFNSDSTTSTLVYYEPNKKDTTKQSIITVEPTENKQVPVAISFVTPGSIIEPYMDNVESEKIRKQVEDILLAGALNESSLFNQKFDQFEQLLINYDNQNGLSGDNSMLNTFRSLLEEYKDDPQKLVEIMFGSNINGLYTGKFDTTYLAPIGTPLRNFQTAIMRAFLGGGLITYDVNIEEQFTIVGESTWKNYGSLDGKFSLYEIKVRFKNKHFKIEVKNEKTPTQTRVSLKGFNAQSIGLDLKFNMRRSRYLPVFSVDIEEIPYIPPSPQEDLIGYLEFIRRIGFSKLSEVHGLTSKTSVGIQSIYNLTGEYSFDLTYFKVGEKRILNPGGGQQTRFLGVPRTYFTEGGTRFLYKPYLLGYEVYTDITGGIMDLEGSWKTIRDGGLSNIKEYTWGSVKAGTDFRISPRVTMDISTGYTRFPEDDIIELVCGAIMRPKNKNTFYKWIVQVSKSMNHEDGWKMTIKLEITTP